MRCHRLVSAGLLATLSRPLAAQADRERVVTLDAASTAIERVRAKFFAMDYLAGVEDADRLLKQFPKSRELAAWRVANLARTDRQRQAKAAAASLLSTNRSDPWGWFARTLVEEYADDDATTASVLEASAQAYRRAPSQPSIVWLRAFALANEHQAVHAIALIDRTAMKGPLSQAMLDLRANAVYNLATATPHRDQALIDSALSLYARARARDSLDAAAYVFPASRMFNLGRTSEAYALAKRGAELSPGSLPAHQYYWMAINGLKDRTQAQRDSEALADVEALMRLRPSEASVLSSAAEQYRSRGQPERAHEIEERIVSVAPVSFAAEWMLVTRYRAMRKSLEDSTRRDSLRPRYVRALWDFVDRPDHSRDRLLGDAYRELFYQTDSTTNADTLLRIVRGMVQYEGINPHIAYAAGAIRLAQRGRDFREAEQIARAGLTAGKAKIESQREIYETVGDEARALDWMSAFMYDALGVVFLHEGRLADAEKQLLHARELDPHSMTAVLHLGNLAERRGALEDAERFYAKGSLVSAIETNPNRAGLKAVYQRRHGSLDGFEAYVAGLADADRALRRAEIAKTRAAKPASLAAFSLKTLDGRALTLDSLRGKTTVINAWGMWCGPCVAEMPEVQKLAARFASDTSVRILTIDNDPNTDELRSWMQKKAYTFTTLIDDGYTKRVGVRGYPTTWFVDPNGRVVFTKVGWSENLVEEFVWRIEMIPR
jgi:thiol-disulfide isomerase/thioredoxin